VSANHKGVGSPVSRRAFLATMAVGAAATAADPLEAWAAATAAPGHGGTRLSPARALAALKSGNKRYVLGRLQHPDQSLRQRKALRPGQAPFATVFSCIDSRVPPEIVFDRGLGDMAVIRTGAQVLDSAIVLGSIQFSVDHLLTPLVVVMGHQRCGAVKATIDAFEHGHGAPGAIPTVVEALRPAYLAAKKQSGNLLDNMVRAQTRLTVKRLRADPVLRKYAAHHPLKIVGAYYSLDTGVVSIIA
jgi:carbonic anhydrase